MACLSILMLPFAAWPQLEVLDPMQTLKKQEKTIRDLKQVLEWYTLICNGNMSLLYSRFLGLTPSGRKRTQY